MIYNASMGVCSIPLKSQCDLILRLEDVRSMPKIDLHRHLTGSITPTIMKKVAAHFCDLHSFSSAEEEDRLFPKGNISSHQDYFISWPLLSQLFHSIEVSRFTIRLILQELADDNVVYTELRTSPKGLDNGEQYSFAEYLNLLLECSAWAEAELGIVVRWIIGIPRHEYSHLRDGEDIVAFFEDAISLATAFHPHCVVGWDLNGIEEVAGPRRFKGVFERIRAAGFDITVHAGETTPVEQVIEAVGLLGATRIGHGISALLEYKTISCNELRSVVYEVCPTSNQKLGVLRQLAELPLPQALRTGGPYLVIASDNPGRLGTSLSMELYNYARAHCLDITALRAMTTAALSYSFADPQTRSRIVERLYAEDLSSASLAPTFS